MKHSERDDRRMFVLAYGIYLMAFAAWGFAVLVRQDPKKAALSDLSYVAESLGLKSLWRVYTFDEHVGTGADEIDE